MAMAGQAHSGLRPALCVNHPPDVRNDTPGGGLGEDPHELAPTTRRRSVPLWVDLAVKTPVNCSGMYFCAVTLARVLPSLAGEGSVPAAEARCWHGDVDIRVQLQVSHGIPYSGGPARVNASEAEERVGGGWGSCQSALGRSKP